MANTTPIIPMLEPQHFSDYGFDTQFDYFRVLDEARGHRKRSAAEQRPLDSLHFKLQKPIAKDDRHYSASKKRRQSWWRILFSWRRTKENNDKSSSEKPLEIDFGPFYLTELGSFGPRTPCRTSRPTSGPLRFADAGEAAALPYVNLNDFNDLSDVSDHRRESVSSPAPLVPIYLVT